MSLSQNDMSDITKEMPPSKNQSEYQVFLCNVAENSHFQGSDIRPMWLHLLAGAALFPISPSASPASPTSASMCPPSTSASPPSPPPSASTTSASPPSPPTSASATSASPRAPPSCQHLLRPPRHHHQHLHLYMCTKICPQLPTINLEP